MSQKISNCILLAAGFGTRLRPLTEKMPKPLIPLGDGKLIDFHLKTLKKFGIENVVINLHYLGEQIEKYLGDGSRYNLNIQYSREPEILGTGGGVKQAASFLKLPSFVINTDIIHHCDLAALAAQHFQTHADATLALRTLKVEENFSPVATDSTGKITSFRKAGTHFFTGIQIITPSLITTLPAAGQNSCLIEQGYEPMLLAGKNLQSFQYEGYWNDLGTPQSYQKALLDYKSTT